METKKYQVADEEIYDPQELEFFKALENDIDSGSYKPMQEEKLQNERSKAKEMATNTIKHITKKKSYTIKLVENDVEKIKAIALQKGLPYQTFISSILHQVATKQISV
ncbi:MAG: hypothetical protein U9N49_13310 [Campylobacterota bacterium]|nr:hypothetical protein [Campylobacterota bacterium]